MWRHPVYGQLTGELHLQSRYDVAQFVEKVRREDAHSLSELTDRHTPAYALLPDGGIVS